MGLVAQESVSGDVGYAPPVGGLRIDAPGSRTTIMSIPLLRPAVHVGRIARVGSGTLKIAAASFEVDSFRPTAAESYYAEVTSGALTGVILPILSNTSSELTLDTGGIDLAQHPLGTALSNSYNAQFELTSPGDMVVIRPCWKVGQILGTSDNDVALTPFASVPEAEGLVAGDRLLVPNNTLLGFEQPPEAELFFVQGVGWRKKGAGQDQSGYPLDPRHPTLMSRSGGEALTLLIPGDVPMTRAATWIPGATALQGREIFVSSRIAQPIAIADSGLWNSDPSRSAVKVSPTLLSRVGELQSFANLESGHSLEPEERWVVVTGQGWKEVGDQASSIMLQPGTGYRLRLRTGSPGGWWLQTPNY